MVTILVSKGPILPLDRPLIFHWELGQEPPSLDPYKVLSLSATGDELVHIRNNCFHVPMTPYNSVVWHNDLARFLFLNWLLMNSKS